MARSKKKSVRGQAWLAKKLKISQPRVCKLMKREGWRWKRSGWSTADVRAIRKWLDELREENPATADVGGGGGGGGAGAGEIGDVHGLADLGDEIDPQALLKLVHKPESRLKLMGVIERAAKVKVDRELLLGGYLKKEDVEAGRVARVQAVRQELSNVRLLAMKLQGKSVVEMEKDLEEWAREVCRKFEGHDGGN